MAGSPRPPRQRNLYSAPIIAQHKLSTAITIFGTNQPPVRHALGGWQGTTLLLTYGSPVRLWFPIGRPACEAPRRPVIGVPHCESNRSRRSPIDHLSLGASLMRKAFCLPAYRESLRRQAWVSRSLDFYITCSWEVIFLLEAGGLYDGPRLCIWTWYCNALIRCKLTQTHREVKKDEDKIINALMHKPSLKFTNKWTFTYECTNIHLAHLPLQCLMPSNVAERASNIVDLVLALISNLCLIVHSSALSVA